MDGAALGGGTAVRRRREEGPKRETNGTRIESLVPSLRPGGRSGLSGARHFRLPSGVTRHRSPSQPPPSTPGRDWRVMRYSGGGVERGDGYTSCNHV